MSPAPDLLTDLLEPLAAARRAREEAARALWAMSAAERVAAMWRRELSDAQLREWSQRAPEEVPRAGLCGRGEFMFIAMTTPEWADAADLPTGVSRS